MNALTPALLAIAALLAERSVRIAGRAEARRRIEAAPADEAGPTRHLDPRSFLAPLAVGVAGFVVAGLPGAVVGVGAAMAAKRMRGYRTRRSTATRRDEQLADAIGALTAAVRAGMSVPQAVAYAAKEAEPPISEDLAQLVARSRCRGAAHERDPRMGRADRFRGRPARSPARSICIVAAAVTCPPSSTRSRPPSGSGWRSPERSEPSPHRLDCRAGSSASCRWGSSRSCG